MMSDLNARPTRPPSSPTTGNTGCDDRSTTPRASATVHLPGTVTMSRSTTGSMNWADLIRSVVFTVSNGLEITDTFFAFAISTTSEASGKPPVITTARTPASIAGSWIDGRSPHTTTSRSRGYRCMRSVNPSALIAPTITSSSSERSGSTRLRNSPPSTSQIFCRLVVTARAFVESAASTKKSSIIVRIESTPTTRRPSTTGIARRSPLRIRS